MNLNGAWEFEMDFGQSGRARGLAQARHLSGTIQVPFCPESALSGVGYKDFIPAVWYRRDIVIPQEWTSGRVLLHVGACDYESWIYLDGREVGHHVGGYTSFTVDLTEALAGRREASLTIYAEDNVRSGAQAKGKQSHVYHSVGWDYTRTTGIWQTVWLESVPTAYISGLKITPLLESGSVHVEVCLNPAAGPRSIRMSAGGACTVTRSRQATLSLSDPRPWSPQDPFLHDLVVEMLDDAEGITDRVESYFGLRSVAINGYAIELNGRPVFQRLILDQGFYPEGIYTAPSDDALRRDIEMAQEMGFNGARLHQKVFEPRFLYWCDRLGYLVWGETPDWGLDVSKAEGISAFMTNWVEEIERDFNHPAIVGWIPFNEHDTRGNPESFRAIYRMTKAFDPTRPCIDSSGWMHVETDIYDVHDYAQDPVVLQARYEPLHGAEGEIYRNLDIVRENAPYRIGQPYFVSEYGGIWWNPGQAANDPAWGYGAFPKSVDEFQYRFKGLTEVLLRHRKMCGFCYTQLTDVEQEVNGLYTFDRQPKFDVAWIRSVVAQPAAIELPGWGEVVSLQKPPEPIRRAESA